MMTPVLSSKTGAGLDWTKRKGSLAVRSRCTTSGLGEQALEESVDVGARYESGLAAVRTR